MADKRTRRAIEAPDPIANEALDSDIVRVSSDGHTVLVDLWYPKIRDIKAVEIGLVDVRSADNILIDFDFERNGWRIRMDHAYGSEIVEEKQEVAFIDAWNEDEDPATTVDLCDGCLAAFKTLPVGARDIEAGVFLRDGTTVDASVAGFRITSSDGSFVDKVSNDELAAIDYLRSRRRESDGHERATADADPDRPAPDATK